MSEPCFQDPLPAHPILHQEQSWQLMASAALSKPPAHSATSFLVLNVAASDARESRASLVIQPEESAEKRFVSPDATEPTRNREGSD